MPARRWSLKRSPTALLGVLGIDIARQRALAASALTLQRSWKEVLNQPGTGEVYERGLKFWTDGSNKVRVAKGVPYGRRSSHRASSPGSAPAPDTGTGALRSAVQVKMTQGGRKARVGMGGEVGRVGLTLEFGLNVTGSKVGKHRGDIQIAPRPHARPAMAAVRDEMTEDWVLRMRDGVKTPNLTGPGEIGAGQVD